MDTKLVESLILGALPDAVVHIEDPRGDGACYTSVITSPSFQGLSRIERHRLVHKAIKGAIGKKIDALLIRAIAPGR